MRRIEARRVYSVFDGDHPKRVIAISTGDWIKIRRVLRAAEVVAKHRKHSFRDLRLAAELAGRAIDALNREPRK